MTDLTISFSREDIAIFEKFGVTAIVLFGSRATGMAGPMSDIDVGILIDNKATLYHADRKTTLYEALYDILANKIGAIVNVDIVFLDIAPLDLQTHVMKQGKPLYESTAGIFANYRERVMETSADFEPYRRMFHASIMSRIHT